MKYTKSMRQADFFRRMSELGFSYSEACRLRRIEMTLRRWGEAECNGEIERREKDDKPERVSQAWINGASSKRTAWLIPDREKGALKRLADIMATHPELWSYHQTDPRGTALYVGRKSDLGTDSNQIVRAAKNAGAKLHWRDVSGRVPSGCWVCLDMNGTDLWHATFNTEELAAEAYLKHRDLSVPPRDVLPLDQCYTRGFGVGY